MSVENETHSNLNREKRTFSISHIIGNPKQTESNLDVQPHATPQRTTKKSEEKREKPSRENLILWKLFTLVSMVLIWCVVLIPVTLSGLRRVFAGSYNTTVNEELLTKINLTNETVICSDLYIYSPVVRTCQPICGHWSSCGEKCYFIERVTYAVIAVVGIVASLVALISWIRLLSTWKFQHRPIFIGIIVNLFQSIAIGICDIPGVYYFICGGEDTDIDSMMIHPNIHTQVIGALIHSLALSNRLWFVIALVYILLKISFPLRDFFDTKKKKVALVILELFICFGIPIITEIISFGAGARYILSSHQSILVSDNRLFAAAFGYIPHALITSFTMSIIMLIIYTIRSKLIGKDVSIQGIEKRLLFFSALYFLLTVIIAASVSVHVVIDPKLDAQEDHYRVTLTLNSLLHTPDHPLANNTVSSLLSQEDRLRITEATAPLLIYLTGGSQRLMFIVVFAVTNINIFTIAKFKSLFNSKRRATMVMVMVNKSCSRK